MNIRAIIRSNNSFLIPFLVVVSCSTFKSYGQNILGNYSYTLDFKKSFSGGAKFRLEIKKDSSFVFHVERHEDIHTDYGKWKVIGDTLILQNQYIIGEVTSTEKNKRENHNLSKYIIKNSDLCWKEGREELCLTKEK